MSRQWGRLETGWTERWEATNLMKFSRERCEVLCLAPCIIVFLGPSRGWIFFRRGSRVPGGKWNQSQPCAHVTREADCVLGWVSMSAAIRSREVVPSPYHWGHVWSSGPYSRLPSTGDWRKPREGPLRWLRVWDISPVRKGWETWDCWAWSEDSMVLLMYINTARDGARKTEAGSFQLCPVTGGAPAEVQEVPVNIGNSFPVRVTEHWHRLPEAMDAPSLEIPKSCLGMVLGKECCASSWGIGPDDLGRSLQVWAIMWFCCFI